MKAIARKVKDNQWIARCVVEVIENLNFGDQARYNKFEQYPIVSRSDIEWLEKNNMDGKEVECFFNNDKTYLGVYTWPEAETKSPSPMPTEDQMKEAWFNWRKTFSEEPNSATAWRGCFQWILKYQNNDSRRTV